MQAYTAARARAHAHAMPIAGCSRSGTISCEAVLLERELEILRSQRRRRPPKQHPHYAPKECAEIL